MANSNTNIHHRRHHRSLPAVHMFSETAQKLCHMKAVLRTNRSLIFHRQQRPQYYRPLAATEYRVLPEDESVSNQSHYHTNK